jgi:hypothetical protein
MSRARRRHRDAFGIVHLVDPDRQIGIDAPEFRHVAEEQRASRLNEIRANFFRAVQRFNPHAA